MNKQTNMNRNTIGAGNMPTNTNGQPSGNGIIGKQMFQAIEIILSPNSGKTVFQNLTQLDGATITGIAILTPKIAAYSAQTYDSNVPTLADLQAMFFTFFRKDIQILENIPALVLNPFNDNDATGATSINNNPFWDSIFSPQIIDFNKSFVWMAATPSAASLKVSLGISYYYAS